MVVTRPISVLRHVADGRMVECCAEMTFQAAIGVVVDGIAIFEDREVHTRLMDYANIMSTMEFECFPISVSVDMHG